MKSNTQQPQVTKEQLKQAEREHAAAPVVSPKAMALAALLVGRAGLKPGASLLEIVEALGFRVQRMTGTAWDRAPQGVAGGRYLDPMIIASAHATPEAVASAAVGNCCRWARGVPLETQFQFEDQVVEAMTRPGLLIRGGELLHELAGVDFALPPFSMEQADDYHEREVRQYFADRGVPTKVWWKAYVTPGKRQTSAQKRLMADWDRASKKLAAKGVR